MIDLLLNLPTPTPQPGSGRAQGGPAGADFAALLEAQTPHGHPQFHAQEHESPLPEQATATTPVPDAQPTVEPWVAVCAPPSVVPSADRDRSGVANALPAIASGPRPMAPESIPPLPPPSVPANSPRPQLPNIPTMQDAAPHPRLTPPAPALPDVVATLEATPPPSPPIATPDVPMIDPAMMGPPRPVITPSVAAPTATPAAIAIEPNVESSFPARSVTPLSTGATHPPVPERHHIGTTVGLIDWLSLPWRLQANAGLSYRYGHAALSPSHVAAQSVATALPRPQPRVGQGSALIVDDLQARLDERLEALRQRLAQWELPTAGVDHDWCGTPGGPIRGGGLLASWLWPQRLLRWRADASGDGAIAWVRDFSLDPSQAQPLVDSILALAQEQGLTLHRIMLNGHEVWSSDSSTA